MAAVSPSVLEGRTLGEFALREKIGEGGFATVHRAFQPALEREAVVKVLHTRLSSRADVVQRFLREARLASRLDHPYAAHVYAFGAEPDGTLWIAMELVRGTPMDKVLEQGPMPVEKLVPLFERICEVVQTAHERGIVHRDLKPANVMVLSRAGRMLPKLLDFGIARVLDDGPQRALAPRPAARDAVTAENERLVAAVSGHDQTIANETAETLSPAAGDTDGATRAGAIMGSPLYMAPEQWSDAGAVDKAADIYALGVLAYEALTGTVPFPATSLQDVMEAHAATPVPPLGAKFPAALDAVIARAMAKRPEDRYASAGDLAAALRAATGEVSDVALPLLDEPLREAMAQGAPQPLAEAIVALEGARNIDQACAILWDVVTVSLRWIGVLVLASRSKVGSGRDADARDVHEHLRTVARGAATDEDWLALARALTRPFVRKRDAYPIPELVTLLHGDADFAVTPVDAGASSPPFVEAFGRLRPLRGALDRRGGRTDEQRRELYGEALGAIADLLRPLRFLLDYTLIVTRRSRAERWRGIRRAARPAMIRRAHALPEGQAHLVDLEGAPVLVLSPLVQTAPPAPGKDEELFLFDGRDASGARLVAVPHGFARHDETLDGWFREHLFDIASDGEAKVDDEVAPYRGLAPFTVDDAPFYFGREAEIDAFVNRLRVESFLAVVGPSGAGKSSFVQAGVLPRLPQDWRAIVVRPGITPAASLASRLARAGIDVTGLAEDPRLLGARLRAAAEREATTIVLVVDQLEELFTLVKQDADRTAFIEAFATAARDEEMVRVVVTLRDDFLIRAEAEPALRERIGRGIKLLTTPGPEDLERILVEPARRVGYQFEDRALVGEIVADVAGQPGALALLSFTAAELWKLRDRHFHQLSRKAYAATGGVGGALARHANATLATMAADERRVTREAFRQLVTAEGTRQVLLLSELQQVLAPQAAVIDRLVAARLLVISEDASGEPVVEVVHEALLAAWPELVAWRREDAEGARLRDQLRAAAKQWDARGRPRGLLWRDEALAEYRIWRTRYSGALTAVEDAFGSASVADANRARRVRRGAMIAAFAVLVIGLTAMFQLRRRAEEQRAIADRRLVASYVEQGRQSLMSSDHVRALAFLVEARRLGGETSALRFLLERAVKPFSAHQLALTLDASSIWGVAYSATGDRLATAHENGKVAVWRTTTGERLALIDAAPGTVFDVAFTADDRLVTAGSDGRVRVFDARSGAEVAAIRPSEEPAYSVELAGPLVVAGGWGGKVMFWNPATKASSLHAVGEGETFVTVARDGSRVAALAKRAALVTIFDPVAGTILRRITAPASASAAAFSPDGKRLAIADEAGVATLWDLESGLLLLTLAGHDGALDHVAYSPDGKSLVTAGRDRFARVWSTETGQKQSVLSGHAGIVWRAQFSADSRRVITLGGAGDAAVWDAATGRRTALFEGHTSVVYDAAISPDGTRIATASWDGLAHQWQLVDRDRKVELAPIGECGDLLDGSSWIAAGCDTGTRVWDLDGKQLGALPPASRIAVAPGGAVAGFRGAQAWVAADGRTPHELAHPTELVAIAVSERGVVTLDRGNVLRSWRDGTQRWQRPVPAHLHAIAFAPSGDVLVTGGRDAPSTELARFAPDTGEPLASITVANPVGGVAVLDDRYVIAVGQVLEIWDSRTWQRVATLAGHVGAITDVRLSRDRSRLVTASGDATARVWKFPSGELVSVLAGSPQYVTSADFTPSGKLVVTTGGDAITRFWDPRSGHPLWSMTSVDRDSVVRYGREDSLLELSPRGAVAVWDLGAPQLDAFLASGLPCWAPWHFDRESGRAVPREGDGC